MIVRQTPGGDVVLIRQADHADLAAQFAAHFGNESFAAPTPFETMVRATTYHDHHFGDIEAKLPIDPLQGRPYGHRDMPFAQSHLDAIAANISWLLLDDPYSGLLVSMHHSGLPQNRYGLVNSWQTRGGAGAKPRTIRPEVASSIGSLEKDQLSLVKRLTDAGRATDKEIQTNYRLLQFFDLLSLYLCCDGYQDGKLVPTKIGPVPMDYGGRDCQEIHVEPQSESHIRLAPYPFDVSQLRVSVSARLIQPCPSSSPENCRAAVMKAGREYFSWTLVP